MRILLKKMQFWLFRNCSQILIVPAYMLWKKLLQHQRKKKKMYSFLSISIQNVEEFKSPFFLRGCYSKSSSTGISYLGYLGLCCWLPFLQEPFCFLRNTLMFTKLRDRGREGELGLSKSLSWGHLPMGGCIWDTGSDLLNICLGKEDSNQQRNWE